MSFRGPARFVAHPAGRWSLNSIDLPGRGQAKIVATFGLDPDADRRERGAVYVEIQVAGDAALLVVLVRMGGEILAWRAEGAGPGRAIIHVDIWWIAADVRVLELSTKEAAENLLQRYAPHVATETAAEPLEPTMAEPREGHRLDEAPVTEPPEQDRDLDGIPKQLDLPGGAGEGRGRVGRGVAAEPALGRAAEPKPKPKPKARGERKVKTRRAAVPEEPAAAAVPAKAMAQMPATARVGAIVTVKFTLSWLRVEPEEGAEVAVADVDIDPDSPVKISISTHGFRLARGTRRVREVQLTLDGAKAERNFSLEAVDVGPAEVTIVVRQHHETPLATLRLTPEIVIDPTAGDLPPANVFVRMPDPRVLALPTIRIDESLAGGAATLQVAVQVGDASMTAATKSIDKARVVTETYEKIKTLCADLKDEPPDVRMEGGLDRLRAIGVDLARRVFTREVRRFLWGHLSELDHLFIQTTGEFDIPWEMIYISDPDDTVEGKAVERDQFLGMRGATRWVYNTAWSEQVTVSRGRAKYLCPSYRDRRLSLTFTQGEGRFVKSVFNAKVVRPGDAASMTKIIADGFDLLHFGGHGVWTAAPPDQRLLLAAYRRNGEPPEGSSYSATELRRDLPAAAMVDPTRAAPMVFLNACDVGRLDTSSPGLGGFPEAFIRGGVGVLLGCCWAVDDKVAGRFVHDFYEALKTKDLHDAVGEARRKSLDGKDLSGLAYVAYAHPYATVTIV